MQLRATNKSAAITGIYAGVLALMLGPRIDNGGPAWLLFSIFAFAGPAYFLVFGVSRADMVGLWMFRTSLLKRIALFFAGIICVAFLAQVIFLMRSGRVT